MIHTNRTVTIGNQESIIDSPIILYRGDREVEVEFTLNGNKFTFTNGGNVIKSTNATHGQLVINTPTGENMFSDITGCHEGKVVFLITKEMIDELVEIGFYSFQIRLFDASQVSRVTIPPVFQGIDIRNPIAAEDETNVVDIGLVDYAVVQTDEYENLATFLPDGSYNKTDWESKGLITEAKLDKIEDALYTINENMGASDLSIFNRIESINQNVNRQITEFTNEADAEIEAFETNVNTNIEQFKIDTNAAMTAYKNEVSEVIDGFSGEIESINSQLTDNKKLNRSFRPTLGASPWWMIDEEATTKERILTDLNEFKKMGIETIPYICHLYNDGTGNLYLAEGLDNFDYAKEEAEKLGIRINAIKVHCTDNVIDGIGFDSFKTQYEEIVINICNEVKNMVEYFVVFNELPSVYHDSTRIDFVTDLLTKIKNFGFNTGVSFEGSMDAYKLITNTELANAIDTIFVNHYPAISFKAEKTTLNDSVIAWSDIKEIEALKRICNKPIIISESGVQDFWECLSRPARSDWTGLSQTRSYGESAYIYLYGMFKALNQEIIEEVWLWYPEQMRYDKVYTLVNKHVKGEHYNG